MRKYGAYRVEYIVLTLVNTLYIYIYIYIYLPRPRPRPPLPRFAIHLHLLSHSGNKTQWHENLGVQQAYIGSGSVANVTVSREGKAQIIRALSVVGASQPLNLALLRLRLRLRLSVHSQSARQVCIKNGKYIHSVPETLFHFQALWFTD